MKKRYNNTKSLVFEELEPRLLFSADGAEALAVDVVEQDFEEEPVVTAQEEVEAEANDVAADNAASEEADVASSTTTDEEESTDQEITGQETAGEQSEETVADIDTDISVTSTEENESDTDTSAASAEEGDGVATSIVAEEENEAVVASETELKKELVLVNDNVQDYDTLISSIEVNEDATRSIEVLILDHEESGVDQVSSLLAEHDDLDAIHIITHGSDGLFALGSEWVDNDDLLANSETISTWGGALSEDADILLYGCNIAADDDGQTLINTLAGLTGADVAASDDITGFADLGGDWDLEQTAGTVETTQLISSEAQQDWDHVLSTYTVTNLEDSGEGSLRQAIIDANANSDIDTITFDISGAGPHTINLESALPTITESVIIDGWSVPDFAGAPIIEINGAGAGEGADGFFIDSTTDVTIRGLVINRFDGNGIHLFDSDNVVIEGNYIGTDVTGTLSLANERGIWLQYGSGNNTIGGTSEASRNVISGNTYEGIILDGSGVTGNVIQGNYIGTDANGTTSLGNGAVGLIIRSGADNNTVGGTAAGAGNVISGNAAYGISLDSASGEQIYGNYIGTDASGTSPLANSFGIVLLDSSDNTIGGNTAAHRNVISGNSNDGINIGGTSDNNIIQGNYIGTDSTGTSAVGNDAWGIAIGAGCDNLIGGTEAGEGNIIANNGGLGIGISPGTGNSILGNSIVDNGGLGIDLDTDGVTANDAAVDMDSDSGANDLQNFPVITAVGTDSSNVAIAGSINSTAYTTLRIEFFSNTNGDASGYGEGETYLGATTVFTDGDGNASYIVTFDQAVTAGESISATATVMQAGGTYGSTSEFSLNVAADNAILVDTTDDVIDAGDGLTSLREAIIAVNDMAGASGPQTIFLPAGTYTLAIAGSEDDALSGDLDLREDVTIIGAGATSTIINANGIDRVFSVLNGSTAYISGVTVTGGVAPSQGGSAFYVTNSNALVMSDSIISGNSSVDNGGAIANYGSTYLSRVQVTGNSSEISGGAIYNGATLVVTDSTLDNNSAINYGGAIFSASPTLIVNTTISTNSADNGGGGVYGSDLTIINTAIVNNSSSGGFGGGIDKAGSSDVTLQNTIIAGNSGTSGNDVYGTIVSSGNNIIGDTAYSSGWIASDQQDVDPLLASLADNGGATPTHAFIPGTTAIDGGSSTNAPVTDQRGEFRDSSIDIGAYEYVTGSNSAPAITSSATAYVMENSTAVATVTAADFEGDTLSFSISGGADAHLFSIDAGTGALTFDSAPSFTPAGDANGDNIYEVTVEVSDGSLTGSQAMSVNVTPDTFLWFSTVGMSDSPSGVPGLDSWEAGSLLQAADPNLSLENGGTTNGTFDIVTSFAAMEVNENATDISGLHYVSTDVMVGDYQVYAGDVLVSFAAHVDLESENTVSANADNIMLFRPGSSGDFSSGTWYNLLDNPIGMGIGGFTLIESDVVIGTAPNNYTLSAGNFLIAGTSGAADIQYVEVAMTGSGNTPGTYSRLIEASEVDLDGTINALELIETDTVIGGRTLTAGQILVALSDPDDVGSGSTISVTEFDVFALNVASTELVGSNVSNASATLIFEGGEVGLDTNEGNPSGVHEEIASLTLYANNNSAPTDLSSGIELNIDGGNDAYLLANDGGAILGGQSELTFDGLVKT